MNLVGLVDRRLSADGASAISVKCQRKELRLEHQVRKRLVRLPLFLAALKKRWPILTTVAAGLIWVLNNYDIRGLDGLRLEPKSNLPTTSGYGLGTPSGFPVSMIPSSLDNSAIAGAAGGLSGTLLPGTTPPGMGTPGSVTGLGNVSAGYTSTGYPSTGGNNGWPAQMGFQTGYPNSALSNSALSNSALSNSNYPSADGINLPPGTMAINGGSSAASTGIVNSPGINVPGAYPSNMVPTGVNPPGNLNLNAARSIPSTSGPAGDDWSKLLSVGEKLGMLEKSRQPIINQTQLTATAGPNSVPGTSSLSNHTSAARDYLRIASFNLSGFGDKTKDRPGSAEIVARLLSQFCVIAVQDIRSRRDDVLPNLVALMNSQGRQYDFMIGPRVGRGDRQEQLGFIFDTERVETDRFQLYTVADPEDMLACEPLVGWFRARQVDSREAFTFSLVSVHIDSDSAGNELPILPNLVEAIANDGRGEDDIILAGDFSPQAKSAAFFASSHFRPLIEDMPTDTRGTQLSDNLLIPALSSGEFTGRSGAWDFLRQYNLSLEQALSVSEHLPVWADFSIIEGGRPGQVAGHALSERATSSGQAN